MHREFGRRFLAGLYLYDGGYCYPYMPVAAMYFSPLALFDRSTAIGLRYAAAIGSLWLTFRWLSQMAEPARREAPRTHFWISLVSIVLVFQFLLYDLDDGGPHSILLGIIIGGVYAIWRNWKKTGAALLGLAAAVKITPAIFIPFFLWKREWRLAGYTAVALLVWTIMPAIWMGPTSWWTHQQEWAVVAAGSAFGRTTPIAESNTNNIRNSGLQHALMRYLTTYPADHPLRREDPGYVSLLDLPSSVARAVTTVAIVGLFAVFGWHTRIRYRIAGSPLWVWETSGLVLLMLLTSPLTWMQHLTWLIPALYLIAWQLLRQPAIGAAVRAALLLFVILTVVLTYAVLGKAGFAMVLGYRPYMIAMLIAFALLWHLRPRQAHTDVPA
jgi:hypothetical protein